MKLFRNRRRFFIALGAVSVAASVILTILFRQQIRAALVVPISYVIWYVNLILETVPQPIFWLVLVLGGFLIAGRAILRNLPQPELPPEPVYHGHSASRYQYWMWYMTTYQISPFSSENLARSLSRFILDILAHEEHLTIADIEEGLRNGQFNLPDDIRAFLIERRLTENQPVTRPVLRWFDRLLRRTLPASMRPTGIPEAQRKLQRIISFIEERLELSHMEL